MMNTKHDCKSLPANLSMDSVSSSSPLVGYAGALTCVAGIATNVANVVVLSRASLAASPTNLVLSWLALADLGTMLAYLPSLLHFHVGRGGIRMPWALPPSVTASYAWARYQQVMISFVLVAHSCAVWFTVLLALVRLVHISRPVHGPLLANIVRTRYALIGLVLVCTGLTVPNVLINSLYRCTVLSARNRSVLTLYEVVASGSLFEANFWIQSVLVKILPTALLTVLTALLLLRMQDISRQRQRLLLLSKTDSQSKKRENRATLMLLMVVILFLVVEMPHGLLMLCSYFSKQCYARYLQLGDLIDFLTLVNESINFILYTTMSKQFRLEFIAIFCHYRKPKTVRSITPKRNSDATVTMNVVNKQTDNKSVNKQLECQGHHNLQWSCSHKLAELSAL